MVRLALALVVLARIAHADARLDERGACFGVKARVEALVGRDPFSADAPLAIAVTTELTDDGAHGTLAIAVEDHAAGRRTIEAASCDALVDELALAIALVLAAPPPQQPPPSVVAPPPLVEIQPPEVAPPWELGALAGAATTVTGTPAIDLGIRVKHAGWSVGAVFGSSAGEDVALAPGVVHVARGEVSLLPCLHLGRALACADLAAGWISGSSSGFASTSSATMPFAATGLRLGWEQPLGDWLSVQAYIEGRVALTTNRFFIDDMAVWTDPRFEAWLGIAAVAHIP